VLLQRRGDDLGGARARGVHEDHQRNVGEARIAARPELAPVLVEPGGRAHDPLVDEQRDRRNRLGDEPTGVVPQVDDDALGAAANDTAHGALEVRGGPGPEGMQADVAVLRSTVCDEPRAQRRCVDLLPHQGEVDRPLARALHGQANERPLPAGDE
jgi:hypothetical protein